MPFGSPSDPWIPGVGYVRPRKRQKTPTIVTVAPTGHVTAIGPHAEQAIQRAKTSQAHVQALLRPNPFALKPTTIHFDPQLGFTVHGLGTPTSGPPIGAQVANLQAGLAPRSGLTEPPRSKPLGIVEKTLRQAEERRQIASEPSTLTDLTVAAALSPIGPEALLAKAGAAGLERLAPLAARAVRAATEGGTGARVAEAARSGVFRRAAAKIASSAEPEAVRAARLKALARAAKAAERVPKPIRTGAKVGTRVVGSSARHPFAVAPFTAQAPFAALHGDPGQFMKALEGKGVYADVLATAGNAAGVVPVAGQVAKEALNVPAQVVPSVYLAGKAGVEAAGGNPKALDAMWADYVKNGLLPALAKGDPHAAVHALENHPLYSVLEASGALSAVGRGAGAIARSATNGRVGGLARPDLTVEGYPNVRVQRTYSRDLIRQLLQRANDRRTENVIRPGTGRRLTPTLERRGDYLFRKHVVREAGDRFNANAQEAQRLGRNEAYKTAADLLPRKKVLGVFKKLDHASADVVIHAIERTVQHPETFHADLRHYLDQLNAVASETVGGRPVLDKAEMAANRSMAANIEKALSFGPERVQGTVDAANAFIAAMKPITEELVKYGVLDANQAARASMMPWARIHRGAQHGRPEGLIAQAKADLEAARQNARETARQRVVGAAESRSVARQKLATAESGRIAAERTVATLKARTKAAPPKTAKGAQAAARRIEQAQATLDTARERVRTAKAEARQTDAELRRQANAATREYGAKIAPAEKALSDARKQPNQLIDRHGHPLTTERLRAEMAEHGIEEPGFVSHRPGTRGDYWRPTNQRDSIPKGKRTGQSAARGTHDSGFEAVIRQTVRARTLLERVKTWDEFITRFGMVARGVKADSMSAAQKVLRDPARYGLNPDIEWVAVRRHPWLAMKREIEAALEHQDPQIASESILSDALARATSETGPDSSVVFMPRKVVAEMEAQFQPLGTALKGAQLLTSGMKRAVLPFSPSYYFGNAIDNAIRTALAGIGPQHFYAGLQIGKHLSEERKSQLLGAAYGSVEKLAARRTHEDFMGSSLQGIAEAAAKFRAAPGPKQFIDLLNVVTHAMLRVNSQLTERLPQYGALGKIAMQDVRNAQGHWAALIRLMPKYAEDWAKGLDNQDTMVRVQKQLEEVYGNWSRMSPDARKYLTNLMPFWTWSRAALKFVYMTMPTHHPIQTALLTAAGRMTETERKALGLDLFADEPLPSYL